MNRGLNGYVMALLLAFGTWASAAAQSDASALLAAARTALGGDARLAAVSTMEISGRTARARPDGATVEHDFEMAFEAPDRFVRRSVLMALGPTSIYRHSGFDGETAIEWLDTPPSLAGGGNTFVRMRWQSDDGADADPTPAQLEQRNAVALQANRADFARLALGLFAAAPAGFPLTFTYAGQAESPDGRADVVDASGPGGFQARLFIDARTRHPLMVSWQAPAAETLSAGGPGGNTTVIHQFEAGAGNGHADPSAMAERPLVEHRLVYADYKTFEGGVRLPTRLQLVVDGSTVEETTFERVRINPELDSRTFATSN